ncbi:MAG: hypothetical protein F9K25_13670 [Candidatus Contendobacter sp.]|nr:MAG: hypothetical protein F9K25_13670 [Candidatus Contendobacter sp.]
MLTRSPTQSRTPAKGLRGGWILLLSLLVAPALAANKCVEPSGRIFYQAAPCPANARGGDMNLNINQPFTGQAKPPASEGASATPTDSPAAPPQSPSPTPDPAARPNPDTAHQPASG